MMNCHWRNAPTAGSVRLKAEQDLLGWLAQIVWFCVGAGALSAAICHAAGAVSRE